MPQFSLYSEFIPLLDTAKNQLAELKALSQEFLRSGDSETKQKALLRSQELEKTKQRLIDLKKEPTDFEGNQIPRIEKELLTFLKKRLDKDLKYEVSGDTVSKIDIIRSQKPIAILEGCLKYLKLFDSLQWLYCSDTQIASLPELPDSLQWLNCSDTTVAKKSKTKQQLEEFKKNHPQFEYAI